MKICLINNLYKPFARGGAETAVESYAKLLQAAGHEIIIITTLPRGKAAPDNNDKILYLGGLSALFYYLHRQPIFFRFLWHLGNLFNLPGYFHLKKILARAKPDLIMTHNLLGIGFLAPLAFRRLQARHFHFLHDIQLLHPSGLMIFGQEKILNSLCAKIYQFFTRKFFASPEKIISPSAWLMQEHTNRGFFKNAHKLIIGNPTPAACHKTRLAGGENFRFLYVGQIESHKGVLFLTETFAELKNKSAELVIIGDGSQSQAVKKICETNQKIIFLGRKAGEAVLTAMSQADCLVVPSLCYENAPTVILEAISCALPIIASAIGGISELISDEKYLFTPGDSNDLKNKLDWVLNNSGQLQLTVEKNKTKLISVSQIIDKLNLD